MRKRRTRKKKEDAQVVNEQPKVQAEGYLPTVAIDFDGVIHAYRTGWQGAVLIADKPVTIKSRRAKVTYNSIDWITGLINSEKVKVAIFSSRNTQGGAIEAMKEWLLNNGMEREVLEQIDFPTEKPPCIVLVDDRCLRFEGHFFTVNELLEFKPWKMQ